MIAIVWLCHEPKAQSLLGRRRFILLTVHDAPQLSVHFAWRNVFLVSADKITSVSVAFSVMVFAD
jgi:hypothetical protein